jgi:hypothetical protein
MPLYLNDVAVGQKFKYRDMPFVEFLRIPDLYDPFSERTYNVVRLDATHLYDGLMVHTSFNEEIVLI